jgi:hypothetical protein
MNAAHPPDDRVEHPGTRSTGGPDGGPPPTVVGLRAWGYLSTEPGGATACSIRQSAVLDDGREVTLADDRGWTTSAPWEALSMEHAVRNIDTAVLPDDAETTGETQEWPTFIRRLREAGVAVDVKALRALPWEVMVVVRRTAAGPGDSANR